MAIPKYDCWINDKQIGFYHNTKTHQIDICIDGEIVKFTKAKGEAIIKFLKLIL